MVDDFSLYQTAPIRAFTLLFTLTIGWPLYLTTNIAGREYPRWASHFDPSCPIFTRRERSEVVVSDVALGCVMYGLCKVAQQFGWAWVTKTYILPLAIVNFWLVMITLLQHTHPSLPHYKDEEWDWLRGALSTVDRDYGILNHFFHHIADTHVAHHLFSKVSCVSCFSLFILSLEPLAAAHYAVNYSFSTQ